MGGKRRVMEDGSDTVVKDNTWQARFYTEPSYSVNKDVIIAGSGVVMREVWQR
jgi:hypothetical protein